MKLHLVPEPYVPSWRDRANCLGLDPNLFFPERGGDPTPAKATCAACTVRAECLDYALENGEMWGIWGGLTRLERRRIRMSTRTPGTAA